MLDLHLDQPLPEAQLAIGNPRRGWKVILALGQVPAGDFRLRTLAGMLNL